MPKIRKGVCRITWRKGEPLGLAAYSAVCFLDLPREIRDRIYYDALVASRPITVSSITIHSHEIRQNDTKRIVVSREYTVEGKDPIFKEMSTNLLWCHPIIAPEAATCFYQSNTFHFEGNEVW